MSIKKIDYSVPELVESYLAISISEMREIHKKIVRSYNTYLSSYGVKTVWKELDGSIDDLTDFEFIEYLDAKELQLIFLYKHLHCFVHKDMVSEFVRKYKPNAALDQQVRHLGTQLLWYVLNKGANVPDMNETVPSGYNYLVSIETPNPKAVATALKRSGRLAAKSFEDLKIVYGCKCATCGIEEGKKDTRNELIVALQQGHMNPRKALTLDNTIPQCQYCNQQYLDYFCFNEHGRVIAVNNPYILLKSPKDIQDEMIEVLLAERKKK
jgi:hypothetical protein